MELKVRVLNKGEVFPSSIKCAKVLFGDTDVVLNYAYYGRDFGTFANTPDSFYVKHNVRGKIIASMYMSPGKKRALLNLFVLKETEYTVELKKEFDEKLLFEFYHFYQEKVNSKEIAGTHIMLVELVDKSFKLHKSKYR